MKHGIRLTAAVCTAALLLTACGKRPENKPSEPFSEPESTQLQTTEQEFRYTKKELPDGWTIQQESGTSSYLEAVWGKEKQAPTLTVSVLQYDDRHGYGKAKALAEAVHVREKKSSDVGTRKIGGTDFYFLSFPSPNDKTLLRYEFYGQTEPDRDSNYTFYIIVLDQLVDEKQFEKLQNVLDCIDFSAA